MIARQKAPAAAPTPVILAMETSGQCGGIALVSEAVCLAEQSLFSRVTHSRRLLASIEKILHDTGLALEELSGVAVSLGPGSFTGLRIGLATAQGLCLASGLPLIGVPTLDGLAAQLPFVSMPICALTDARRNEVFAAFYHWQDASRLQRDSDYLAIAPEALVEKISRPTILIGDGLGTYGSLLTERLGTKAMSAPASLCFNRAAAIGALGLARWQQGEFQAAGDTKPLYVRASEAEINYRRAHEATATGQ